MIWVLLTLLYGVFKGLREIVKKKALGISDVMEVLVMYTLIGFVMVIPQAKNAGGLVPIQYVYIFMKSLAVFSAWIFSFHALKKMPVSLYGILDLSRVLFATLRGVFVLGEVLKITQVMGLILVCTGLLMLKFKPFGKSGSNENVQPILVVCAFLSCIRASVKKDRISKSG